jgi:hypothetical protein
VLGVKSCGEDMLDERGFVWESVARRENIE